MVELLVWLCQVSSSHSDECTVIIAQRRLHNVNRRILFQCEAQVSSPCVAGNRSLGYA